MEYQSRTFHRPQSCEAEAENAGTETANVAHRRQSAPLLTIHLPSPTRSSTTTDSSTNERDLASYASESFMSFALFSAHQC